MKLSAAKLLSVLLCIAVFLLPLFSMGIVAVHGDHGHDCRDDDCVICACLHMAEQTMRLTGMLLPWLTVAAGTSALFAALARRPAWALPASSPVRMRVRLDQ